MPMLPETAAAITNTLDSVGNYLSAAGTNKKQRKWNEKMYGIQRADALADWTMQNEYNSPTSQMKRLREAGLNPHLVYGNGADAQSTGNVRSSDSGTWNPRPPEFNLGSGMQGYFDTQIKQATLDNLKEQNTVIKQEALLKEAQIGNLGQQTATGKFNLEFEKSMVDVSAQSRRLNLDRTTAEIDVLLDRNHREAAMQAVNIQEAVKRMLQLDANTAKTDTERAHILQQIKNLEQDYKIKKYDEMLSEYGISKSDPFWLRQATIQYRKYGGKTERPSDNIGGGLGQGFKKGFKK